MPAADGMSMLILNELPNLRIATSIYSIVSSLSCKSDAENAEIAFRGAYPPSGVVFGAPSEKSNRRSAYASAWLSRHGLTSPARIVIAAT